MNLKILLLLPLSWTAVWSAALEVTEEDLDTKLASCAAGETTDFTCDDMVKAYGTTKDRFESMLYCTRYDRFHSPLDHFAENSTLDIFATVWIDKIVEVDTELQTAMLVGIHPSHIVQAIELDFTLELAWRDPRLSLPDECLAANAAADAGDVVSVGYEEHDPGLAAKIWLPPLELENILDMEDRKSFRSGKSFRLALAGHVITKEKYSARISCPMDFRNFPFDRQICDFNIYLERGSRDLTKLDWYKSVEKTTFVENLVVPEWSTHFKEGDSFIYHNDESGEENEGLSVEFTFARVFASHLMHTFIPSIMIATCSVLSVFVPSDLVPGRMGLCITAFLSMISLFNGTSSKNKWPLTSYLKILDIWVTGSYLVVFSALVEYCVVLYLVQKAQWERKIKNHLKSEGKKKMPKKVSSLSEAMENDNPHKVFDVNGEQIRKKEMVATKIEKASRVLLPAFYIIFNVIFWIVVVA